MEHKTNLRERVEQQRSFRLRVGKSSESSSDLVSRSESSRARSVPETPSMCVTTELQSTTRQAAPVKQYQEDDALQFIGFILMNVPYNIHAIGITAVAPYTIIARTCLRKVLLRPPSRLFLFLSQCNPQLLFLCCGQRCREDGSFVS